ncbi:MAG: glucosamine-6-phosphate deaminase [Peptoniphilaceae bacterium]|nr:glucosamine-6-phosphate deaminase [Peptoniphilaceae bacterium]MDD7382755.1 glucosamine-6-phosphate deaminase [Peptoniphilaceae bacterium]MDY3737911.1 glucosamine-6-phosphate deaminase [Peptoniphilaceae bacterium]
MKFKVLENYDEMSEYASEIIKDVIKNNANPKLGLATGSTPIGTYKKLVKAYEDGEIDFSNTKTVNLDEYVGIDIENTQSYRFFMNDNLFDHVNIDKNNTNVPRADLKPLDAVKEYNKLLDNFGRRHLQLLGAGPNGHIAFNEPSKALNARTSIVNLKEETINANSRFFNSIDDVPKQAVSMGLVDIFDADTLLVLASGKNKHFVVDKFLNSNEIDPQFPLSFIKLHANAIFLVDKEAYEG